MATRLTLLLSLLLTISIFSLSLSSPSPSLESFIWGGCSQLKYDPNSAYASNLHSLLSSLASSAAVSSFSHLSLPAASPSDTLHGLFQCRGDLPLPICASCVSAATSRLLHLCPGACGGALQLQGCFVKYDNATFIGVEDKTVVLKKCGPSMGEADSDKINGRDGVLEGLVNGGGGGGYYRVGGSREVEGVAQCVGDMSGAQCQDCIEEGVKEVKKECERGSYADVFLGKCYVRYTIGGAHAYYSSSNGTEKNRGIKTFAWVIGLLAAIAIAIIFLTFLCRVFTGSSK